MVKDRFWQKTIAVAIIIHIVQSLAMMASSTEANVLSSLGMVTIIIAFIFRLLTATEQDFREQQSDQLTTKE